MSALTREAKAARRARILALHHAGYDVPSIATTMGLRPSAVIPVLRRATSSAAEQRRALRERAWTLHRQGVPGTAIAADLGVSQQAVSALIRRIARDQTRDPVSQRELDQQRLIREYLASYVADAPVPMAAADTVVPFVRRAHHQGNEIGRVRRAARVSESVGRA